MCEMRAIQKIVCKVRKCKAMPNLDTDVCYVLRIEFDVITQPNLT